MKINTIVKEVKMKFLPYLIIVILCFLVFETNSAPQSGLIKIIETSNHSPFPATDKPTLYIYSADETNSDDYFEISIPENSLWKTKIIDDTLIEIVHPLDEKWTLVRETKSLTSPLKGYKIEPSSYMRTENEYITFEHYNLEHITSVEFNFESKVNEVRVSSPTGATIIVEVEEK